MRFRSFTHVISVSLAAFLIVAAAGCGQRDKAGGPAKSPKVSGTGPDHSGWWCVEHGIPEEECSMCSAKAAAKFKEKGDWCEEHNRAESQCFICNPERAKKYAALYEAKYGKKPPKPTE